jgi:hypothetical protein
LQSRGLRVSAFVFSSPLRSSPDKETLERRFPLPGLVTALRLRRLLSPSYNHAFPNTTLTFCLLAACGFATVTDAWIALNLFLACLACFFAFFYTPTGNHAGARG